MINKVTQYIYRGLLIAVMAMGLVLPFAQGVDAVQLVQPIVSEQVLYTTASPASNSQIAVSWDGAYWGESVPPAGYTGNTTAAMVLSLPMLGAAIWFGMDLLYIGMLALVAAFLFIKNFWLDKGN